MWIDEVWRDVRLAARRITRRPAVSIVIITCLGAGIGATSGVYSVVRSVLVDAMPFEDADRLVQIFTFNLDRQDPERRFWVAPVTYMAVAEETEALESVAGFFATDFDVLEDGVAQRMRGARAMPGSFAALGIQPMLGRTFTQEDIEGNNRVALISEAVWRQRYGGDPSVLGRSLDVSGESASIVGVIPQGQRIPGRAEVWVNLLRRDYADGEWLSWGSLIMVGKLADRASREDLAAEFGRVSARLAEREPMILGDNGIEAVTLQEAQVGAFQPPLQALLGASVFVLLIAVANVANLLLARAQHESWEQAVRTALGASRVSLFRQSLPENMILAGLGALLGTAVAGWGVMALLALAPVDNAAFDSVGFSRRTLAMTVGLAFAVALVLSIVPAVRGRTAAVEAVGRGGRGRSSDRRERRIRNTFVMGQVAVSLVLLVGAGLMVRSFRELQMVNPGFSPDGLAVVRVSAPASVAGTHEGRVAFFTEVLARMEALPGVEAAGAAHIFPLDDDDWGYAYSVEDEPPADPNQAHSAIRRIVTHGFFRAAGIPLLRGRTFLESDALDASGVAVVSRAFEERFWPGGSGLGRRIKRGSYGRDRPWLEIVGVVDDVRSGGLEKDVRPAVYYPMSQTDGAYVAVMAVGVRASVRPESLIPAVRRVVA